MCCSSIVQPWKDQGSSLGVLNCPQNSTRMFWELVKVHVLWLCAYLGKVTVGVSIQLLPGCMTGEQAHVWRQPPFPPKQQQPPVKHILDSGNVSPQLMDHRVCPS